MNRVDSQPRAKLAEATRFAEIGTKSPSAMILGHERIVMWQAPTEHISPFFIVSSVDQTMAFYRRGSLL